MKSFSIFLILVLSMSCSNRTFPNLLLLDQNKPVFISGNAGYDCYRIPAIIHAPNGDLLAFAEGRKNGCSDTNDIDLIMKRSIDGGMSWGPLQIIWSDNENTCGNPAPVVDQQTGVIHLLATWNLGTDHERQIIDQTSKDTRRVYSMQSSDNGRTWSIPNEITEHVKLPNWTWYATGPGSGIQIKNSTYRGRLVIACDHIEADSKKYFSHVIFSDDQGKTWQLGGISPRDQVNECEIAELPDGSLILNMRNYDRSQKQRQIAISIDGGINWSDQKHDPILIEPICQASLQSYNHNQINALLFSNPASKEKREKMCVRVSYNNGETWQDSVVIHKGPAAYSDLVVLDNGLVGCLFESGAQSPYEQITFRKLNFNKIR